jgi:hypothetical protein
MLLLRKFLARPLTDKALLVRALVFVCIVRLGLWVLPYRTVHRLIIRPVSPRTEGRSWQEESERRRRIVQSVESISRRILKERPCLTQALVAQRFLNQEGFETTLRIGVAKEGHELLAHAWLERGGRVVTGGSTSPERYKPLDPVQAGAT